MQAIYRTAAMIPVMVLAAAAQDSAVAPVELQQRMQQVKEKATYRVEELRDALSQATVVGVKSAVMGAPVKNAPYSGVEMSENTQTLSDGTHIDRKTQATVYR